MIANLCNKVKDEEEKKEDIDEEEEGQSEDEGVETGEDELENTSDNNEKTSDLEEEDFSDNDDDDDEENKSDWSDVGDLDADTFGDIVLEEDDDDDEEEEEEDKDGNEKNNNKGLLKLNEFDKLKPRTFQSTSYDTKFLNLRESEWIADNDVIGTSAFDDEKIDYMKELENEDMEDVSILA